MSIDIHMNGGVDVLGTSWTLHDAGHAALAKRSGHAAIAQPNRRAAAANVASVKRGIT